MWLSLVEHLVWDQGVQGSNPCIPTAMIISWFKNMGLTGFDRSHREKTACRGWWTPL